LKDNNISNEILHHADVVSEKVVAIIISYKDTDALELTTHAISEQVDQVIIVDNNSGHDFDSALCKIGNMRHVDVVKLEKNEGIGKALNIGVSIARRFKPNWILTLDQDSICEPKLVEKLLKTSSSIENVGIVAASTDQHINSIKLTYPLAVITSGNLVNIKVFDCLSYNEKYFIDSVDFDFCLKVKKSGWKIIQSNNTFLAHRLGTLSNLSLLGFNFRYISHPPLRRYYIFRNHIFLIKDHFSDYPIFLVKKSFFLLKIFFSIIVFDKKRSENIKMIIKGVFHGLVGRT